MNLRSKIIGLTGTLIFSAVSMAAWACGNSACGDVGGTWTCYVETERGLVACTGDDPCNISC